MPCALPADSIHSISATCCIPASRWRRRCSTEAIQPTAWAAHRGCCTVRNRQRAAAPAGPAERCPKPRPVIYNSWEATEFRVSEAGQIALAEKAAALGVDRFVMDDGWFGQRKDDHAGLGDWYVNKEKFPQRPEAAHRQGALAGHGLRPVGRAGDGEPRFGSLSQASRLGAQLPRPPAYRAAQSAGAQSGPSRTCAITCSAFSTSC